MAGGFFTTTPLGKPHIHTSIYKSIHTHPYITTAKIKIKSRFVIPENSFLTLPQSVNHSPSRNIPFHHSLFYMCLSFIWMYLIMSTLSCLNSFTQQHICKIHSHIIINSLFFTFLCSIPLNEYIISTLLFMYA